MAVNWRVAPTGQAGDFLAEPRMALGTGLELFDCLLCFAGASLGSQAQPMPASPQKHYASRSYSRRLRPAVTISVLTLIRHAANQTRASLLRSNTKHVSGRRRTCGPS